MSERIKKIEDWWDQQGLSPEGKRFWQNLFHDPEGKFDYTGPYERFGYGTEQDEDQEEKHFSPENAYDRSFMNDAHPDFHGMDVDDVIWGAQKNKAGRMPSGFANIFRQKKFKPEEFKKLHEAILNDDDEDARDDIYKALYENPYYPVSLLPEAFSKGVSVNIAKKALPLPWHLQGKSLDEHKDFYKDAPIKISTSAIGNPFFERDIPFDIMKGVIESINKGEGRSTRSIRDLDSALKAVKPSSEEERSKIFQELKPMLKQPLSMTTRGAIWNLAPEKDFKDFLSNPNKGLMSESGDLSDLFSDDLFKHIRTRMMDLVKNDESHSVHPHVLNSWAVDQEDPEELINYLSKRKSLLKNAGKEHLDYFGQHLPSGLLKKAADAGLESHILKHPALPSDLAESILEKSLDKTDDEAVNDHRDYLMNNDFVRSHLNQAGMERMFEKAKEKKPHLLGHFLNAFSNSLSFPTSKIEENWDGIDEENRENIAHKLARIYGLGDKISKGFSDRLFKHGEESLLSLALENNAIHPDTVEDLINEPRQYSSSYGPQIKNQINKHAQGIGIFSNYAEVSPNSEKLRIARDLAEETLDGKIHKKELEKRALSPDSLGIKHLQDPKGFISASDIQNHIDSIPKMKFGIDHTEWTGLQRHSWSPSKVFQLAITKDHIKKMKDAGVFDTFKKFHKSSFTPSHPTIPKTGVGWVRYTSDHDGTFIDEIQSDFGQNHPKIQIAKARRAGYSTERLDALKKELEEKYPSDHLEKIHDILFGGKDPNQVIHESFLQHLRDKANSGSIHKIGTPVQIWSPESKAKISLAHSIENEGIPAHMMRTYEQQPISMGYKDSHYGQLATQNRETNMGKPTKQTILRKRTGDV